MPATGYITKRNAFCTLAHTSTSMSIASALQRGKFFEAKLKRDECSAGQNEFALSSTN